jgi:hypothetical protein
MSTTLERPASFGRTSHVRTYWLLHSEGFHVRGRGLRGTVEAVHGGPTHARELVVRRRVLGRRLTLPADAVERVVPAEELLVVDREVRGRRPGRRRARAGIRLAGRSAAASGRRASAFARGTPRVVGAGGRTTGRAARRVGAAAAPPARLAGDAIVMLLVGLAAVSLAVARAGAALGARAARSPLAWLRAQGPELTEELLTRLGRTVGPLDGPQRRP